MNKYSGQKENCDNLKQNYRLQWYNVLNENGDVVNRNRRHLILTKEKFT